MINEEKLSKKRALELYDKNILKNIEIGTFKGLCDIHFYLFQDVFLHAGKIRNMNISKGNFRFASVIYLKENISIIEKMSENIIDEIVEKYVEMNILHPFMEGNGRSMRIWLDQMLKKNLKKCIDWSKIDKIKYLQAMERSPINDLEIKTLLRKALVNDVDNRIVYIKGIDASYSYEGMEEFSLLERNL